MIDDWKGDPWNGKNMEDLHGPEPEPETFPRRWQDCLEFVECLRAREYIVNGGYSIELSTIMSAGTYLYMYELWQDGKRGKQSMKSGDVVRLKSGGPKMTLGEVDNVYGACEWFEHNVVFEREFSVAMLEVVSEESRGYDGWPHAVQVVRRMKSECCSEYDAGLYQRVIDELSSGRGSA